MKAKLNSILSVFQKIGQSLMIPVSVLPAAGLLVALGRILKDLDKNNSLIGQVLFSGGLAIFEQLPLIFAIGVAIGFTGGAGVAGLAAAASYFTLINILKIISDHEKLSLAINTGVFGGIIVGLLAAQIYNRFQRIKLPQILGFFSGKRFVPIMSVAATFVLALLLGYVWPSIQSAIYSFGNSVNASPFGPAFYAAGKRLLIPVGLHHVYYPSFLYEFGQYVTSAGQIVKGDSARYFAGDLTAGRMMASEFPIMLFGLPAAALAMFLAAPKAQRKTVGGVMLSAALTSIITGITEPIEFAFIFVAPVLYFIHVGLAFVSGLLTAHFDIHLGYTFSASLIDFFLGFFNQKNSQYLFLFIGPLISLLYFSSFYTLIRVFNYRTPGREVENLSGDTSTATVLKTSDDELAKAILAALGGRLNISNLDACITRLRVVVKGAGLVNSDRLKALGAAGVMQSGNNVQAIFGVNSDFLKEAIRIHMRQGRFGSPGKGRIMSLSEVPDQTFADKILGDGFAIEPSEGMIISPCAGEISNVFVTNHAVGMMSEDGLEVLIHVGIDSVFMKGEGFSSLVKVGDKVKIGTPLIQFDLVLLGEKAKSTFTPVIITNMDAIKSMKILQSGNISMSHDVLEFEFI